MLPTQTAPRCGHGQAAIKLPPPPSLPPPISISLKPRALRSPIALLPLSLRELQASPGDAALHPPSSPRLFISLIKVSFHIPPPCFGGLLFTAQQPAEPRCCTGKHSVPSAEVGSGCRRGTLHGGAQAPAPEQLKAPPEPHDLPTKPPNSGTIEYVG